MCSSDLANIPSSWYGYKFRCLVSGNVSLIFEIRGVNTWTGAVSNLWENPLNWSCGVVPDQYTDVIINAGTVIVSSNANVRTITLGREVSFSVNPGYTFTVHR